ncbi:LINE-1 reverse transcriptase homolog [Linum perenne]
MQDTQQRIEEVAVDFYKKLLGESKEVKIVDLSKLIKSRLTDSQAEELCRPVTQEEIKKALFSIPNEKSPGPDGFNAGFFKDSWNVVSFDLTEAVLSFFTGSYMPKYVNSIALTLIPKVKNAADMRQFRPISCCNVVYKIAAKIMTKRMAGILPSLISLNQTAFVKGRRIGDGILLAHELLSKYSDRKISPRCAIQIDLMKAFDSVEWTFILDVLKEMNFPGTFIGWIAACFKTSML